MQVSRGIVVGALLVVGCATAATTNVRPPLGAVLTPAATTGATVALKHDPSSYPLW